MLQKEIIEKSDSPYNAPFWVVPKKVDASDKQKWRIVVDFRKLNELTDQDAYPLSHIRQIKTHIRASKKSLINWGTQNSFPRSIYPQNSIKHL